MWLAPAFSILSISAARVYYRLTIAGGAVPDTGPVLLVANHTNSLIDPMLVCAVARRPVRFLAKAPLFDDRKVGWLVRAMGSIPVYRRQDDPALLRRNVDTFEAVHRALAAGAAVGIFPEGRSHSEPQLAELRTGAARVVVGTWQAHRLLVPIVPVGLVFRHKDVFRSDALVVIGRPVVWEDLAGAPHNQAVRAITERIGTALRQITLNLERWEDRPLVEGAVEIWDAELGQQDRDPGSRVQRLEVTARLLSELRREPDPRWSSLIRDVRAHLRRLARLRLVPASLGTRTDAATAVQWTIRRFHLVLPLAAAQALGGAVAFVVPYRATDLILRRLDLHEDERSTWQLLLGAVIHLGWLLSVIVVAAALWGILVALLVLAALPLFGIGGLLVRERWRGAWSDARRFFLLRSRRDLMAGLRADQRELARRFKLLYDERGAGVPA